MTRVAVLAAAALALTALSACEVTKSQQIAECRMAAEKVYPHGPDMSLEDHVTTCMQAHNYKWSPFAGKTDNICGGDMGLSHFNADCYHRVGLWEQATDH